MTISNETASQGTTGDSGSPELAVRIEVPATPESSYPVLIGPGALTRLGEATRATTGNDAGHALLVIDDNLPDHVSGGAILGLEAAGFVVTTAEITATEANKSFETATQLLTTLAATHASRADPVVALGGGITGDLAGFVAATYKRGVPLIQCPTTLLAMVDASVGGKTATNLRLPGENGEPGKLIKNAVGSFHQPKAVLADTDTLRSLPQRHLAAGLAECLKHGLIASTFDVEHNLFAWTTSHIERFTAGDRLLIAELVARNLRVKAAAVASDPFENRRDTRKSRALLNLGHTFGHALETIPDLSPINDPTDPEFGSPLAHGEAVAIGLVAAAAAAEHLGHVTSVHVDFVRETVEALGVRTRLENLPTTEQLVATMLHDKKAHGGAITLVLPTTMTLPPEPESPLGTATLNRDASAEVVESGIQAIRA